MNPFKKSSYNSKYVRSSIINQALSAFNHKKMLSAPLTYRRGDVFILQLRGGHSRIAGVRKPKIA
jgi:hypothetical protein